MENVYLVVGSVVISLVVLEFIYTKYKKKTEYSQKDFFSNIFIFIVGILIKPLTTVWSFLLFSLVEPLQLWQFEYNALMLISAFIIIDFAFYWYHRCSHTVRFLWVMHHTHHSSMWMNLSVAFRLNWLARFISPMIFAPLIIVGISAQMLTGFLAINLLLQFFLHTQHIGNLGWWEGKLFNTPSAHRVHHGSNEKYIDKNFAGVLIIWDRIFGTYQAETETVKYGITTGFVGFNPFKIQFIGLHNWIKNKLTLERSHNKLNNNNSILLAQEKSVHE